MFLEHQAYRNDFWIGLTAKIYLKIKKLKHINAILCENIDYIS